MGRLIATIKYGSLKTKLFLLAVALLLVSGAALAVYGGISYELWALSLGALLMIVGLVMILLANFSTEDVDSEDEDDEDEEDEEYGSVSSGKQRKRVKKAKAEDDEPEAEEEPGKPRKRVKKAKTEEDEPEDEDEPGKPRKRVKKAKAEDDDPEDEEEPGKQRKRVKKAKTEEDEPEDEDEPEKPRKREKDVKDSAETDPDDPKKSEKSRGAGKEDPAERNTPENNNELVSKYTAVVLRMILHKYKVKRDYTPIIIDDSRKFDTAKTPALCWAKRKNVYFLLMEGNERVESMPLAQFLKVTYKHDVKEKNLAAYSKLKDDMGIYKTFEEVMPTFNSVQSRKGVSEYTKNQYVLGGTVAVTPRSMRALRSKFKFDIKLFDSMNIAGEHSLYFKRAVEARVLWTDQVIGQQEYQNMIGAILQQMVEDRELSRYDFLDDLEKMIENRLITDEYADYYMQQRQKRDREARKR